MRSTYFTRILEETTIELDVGYNETLKRLMSFNGTTRETDSGDRNMQFICTKKGRFRIGSIVSSGPNGRRHITERMRFVTAGDRSHYIEGRVSPENRKTKITLYVIHRPFWFFSEYLASAILMLGALIYAVMSVIHGVFIQSIPALFILAIIAVYTFVRAQSIKQNGSEDIEIMKTEALNRIEAIKRWDD